MRRENLKNLLESSGNGRIILFSYEKHKSLNDLMLYNLIHLIIDRELNIIFAE